MAEIKPFDVVLRLVPHHIDFDGNISYCVESHFNLVRCQDCKYAVEDDSDPTRYWCSYKWPAYMVPDNGFCFRGDHK